MPLTVKFLDGAREGEELLFEDDVEMIVFGRDEASCQVFFGEEAAGVAQEHCALMNMGGQYTLYVNEGNTCLVNGEEAAAEHELLSLEISAEMQLGEGGPRLVMGTAILAAGKARKEADKEEEGSEGEGDEQDGARAPTARASRGPWIVTAAALAIAVALLVALLVVAGREPEVAETPPPPPPPPPPPIEQPKADPYADLLVKSRQTRASRDPLHAIDSTETEFADAFKAARSVYLVVERVGGAERARGTAWVAAPGVLVTSAGAVAAAGQRELFVRSSGRKPATLAVTAIRNHPGYGALRNMARSYVPVFDEGDGKAKGLAPGRPCDVALLVVSDEDAEKLEEPLTPATRGARVGERVCAIGFASSAKRVVVVSRPQASFDVGSVLGLVDGFGEQADAATADLVRHALPAFAGAAGSPVLDNRGEVIAILSDGVDDDRRFAVPVSAVWELVEGRADEAQDARTNRWRDAMQAHESRPAVLREEVLADWERELGEGTASVFHREEVARAAASQPAQEGAAHASVTVDEAGPVLVVVASKRAIIISGGDRRAVTMTATVTERSGPNKDAVHACRPLGAHGLYEFIASVRFRTRGKTELEIAATSDDPRGTDVEVTVYAAARTGRARSPTSQEASASQGAAGTTNEKGSVAP